jgi:hypothetical protein
VSRLSHLVNLSPPTEDPTRPRGPMSDKRRWQIHRTNAKMRGIEFKLTFEEWFCWWMDTGHYAERGNKRGEYVMGRKGDKGAYELGNIECTLAEVNSSAPHRLKPIDVSEIARAANPNGRAARMAASLKNRT